MRYFLVLIFLFVTSACSNKKNADIFTEEYYQNQVKITELVQQGMYYYWNGGDYKNAEKEFFKGITLKGNLDVVERFFQEAVALNEYRLDLQHGLASTYIIQGEFAKAFKTYNTILSVNPRDFNAHILYAGFSKVKDDQNTYNEFIAKAQEVNPEKTAYYLQAFDRIDTINKTVFNKSPEKKYRDSEHIIVILGYALAEDGTMQNTLYKRLEKGLELHKIYPNSKIIVSGAVPKEGYTEAGLMKEWLVKKGVPAQNILVEDRAKDTIGNAFFSVDIIKAQKNKAKYGTIISSASHMRRALNVFTEMSVVKDIAIEWDNLVYLDYPSLVEAQKISDNEKTVIYRDFFRASGIWAYPGLQQ